MTFDLLLAYLTDLFTRAPIHRPGELPPPGFMGEPYIVISESLVKHTLKQFEAYRRHQEGPTPPFEQGPAPEQPTRDLSAGR